MSQKANANNKMAPDTHTKIEISSSPDESFLKHGSIMTDTLISGTQKRVQ